MAMIAMLLISAGLAAGAPARSDAGATPPRPIMSGPFMTDDDYPPAALRNGEQGVVEFGLTIDSRGRTTSCRIIRSSGSSSLDQATCTLIQRRMRFEPARDASGKAVAGELTSRMNWKLPRQGAGRAGGL